ncbi:MAG: glycosyltransferase family 4 protein [Pirellulaceae bacterium]
MRILQIRSEFEDSGPGTQSLTIACELQSRGHEVEFLACGGALREEIENAGFAFHVVPGFRVGERGPVNSVKAIAGIAKVLRERQVELVHAHNATSVQLTYFAAIRNRNPLPLVQSVRGVELRKWFQWRNWIYKFSPARLLAVSEFTRQTLLDFGVPFDRVTVTYNGIDPQRFDPDTVDSTRIRDEFDLHDRVVVGHIGAMNGCKGQDVLVEAIACVKKQFPHVACLLVGDGPARQHVERRAAELGVSDCVHFAGMRFESPDFHACFDIYAQPSVRGEMFPNSIIEAMAMRTPWIGSDISGLSEMTADGEAGWVTSPGAVEALANNLIKLLADKELRRARGQRAYDEVHRRFTIQHVVSRIESAYEQALQGKLASRRAA